MKYVYVIYDPLFEKVLCVHSKPNMLCKSCRSIIRKRYKEKSAYTPYECKRKIKS